MLFENGIGVLENGSFESKSTQCYEYHEKRMNVGGRRPFEKEWMGAKLQKTLMREREGREIHVEENREPTYTLASDGKK